MNVIAGRSMVGRGKKAKPQISINVGSSIVISAPLWREMLIMEKLGIDGLKGYMGNLYLLLNFAMNMQLL